MSTDSNSNTYSPIRHMATSLFPSSDRFKFMVMLTAYMDETGHSKDELQRFNGMAGFLAPAENWIDLKGKWKKTLSEFNLPYFHMREFEARHPETGERIGFYKGWSELKREKLYGKLMRHVRNAHAVPLGAILAMDDWRSLTERQRECLHGDPYFLAYQSVIALTTAFIEFRKAPPDVRVEFVFSNQVEFRYRALRLYEEIYKVGEFIKRSAYEPDFRDMQVFVPLQAADFMAYESYKEYDRLKYRQHYSPRWGYGEIAKMSHLHGFEFTCKFYGRLELTDYADAADKLARRKAYWDQQRAKKNAKS